MTLSETISKGLNNPECAFFVGQFMGQATIVKTIFMITLIYFIIKATDKIALEPFLEFIKKKIYKKDGK